jgi:hypothetical protein
MSPTQMSTIPNSVGARSLTAPLDADAIDDCAAATGVLTH